MRQEVADYVEPRQMLVVGVNHRPRRLRRMRAREHEIAPMAVLGPELRRLGVDRAQLPLLQRILAALLEPPLLLALADIEIVFEEADAGADEHLLEGGHGLEEFARLGLGAEAHHRLDAGAVVPTPVEQHHLAAGGKMRDIALKIPGMPVAVGGRPERHDARLARAQMLGDVLDRAVLAAGVAPLEDDENALLIGDDPALQLDEFDLELQERLLIGVLAQLLRARRFLGSLCHLASPLRGTPKNRSFSDRPASAGRSGFTAEALRGRSPRRRRWC